MRGNMKSLRFIAALGAAASLFAMPNVFAQTTGPTAPAAPVQTVPNAKKVRIIKTKNAPSALLAYQIDPAHNPPPMMLQATGKPGSTFYGNLNGDKADGKIEDRPKGAFDLPGDIEQVISVDPQNVLLSVGGSDEDFQRLQELVDVLDQPLRQVEIEAQFIEVSPEDARQFGIDFSTKDADGAQAETEDAPKQTRAMPRIGFVRNNFTARLNALIAANRAKIITAPRVTAINNLSASLGAEERFSVLSKDKRSLTFLSRGANLEVTPTINGDDTVTLLITSSGKGETAKVPGVTIIANVRDGDTFALGGLSPLFAGAGNSTPPNMLVFVTARIIRRAGDINPNPTATK